MANQMSYKIPKLEEIHDKIDSERVPMSQGDGYRWGLDYLKDIYKELEKLEKKALDQNNPLLYKNVKLSIQRYEEAKAELEAKTRA